MIRFYFTLGLFFSFPFLWLAIAFWSWIWLVVAVVVGAFGGLWFRSAAFSLILKTRHARAIENAMLSRISSSLQTSMRFKFWQIAESDAQAMAWVSSNEIHLFFTQGLLARATEEQLTVLLQNVVRSNLKQVQVENRLYALSLWWDELKGQPNRFRYWFISFWLYPLERILKIAKI